MVGFVLLEYSNPYRVDNPIGVGLFYHPTRLHREPHNPIGVGLFYLQPVSTALPINPVGVGLHCAGDILVIQPLRGCCVSMVGFVLLEYSNPYRVDNPIGVGLFYHPTRLHREPHNPIGVGLFYLQPVSTTLPINPIGVGLHCAGDILVIQPLQGCFVSLPAVYLEYSNPFRVDLKPHRGWIILAPTCIGLTQNPVGVGLFYLQPVSTTLPINPIGVGLHCAGDILVIQPLQGCFVSLPAVYLEYSNPFRVDLKPHRGWIILAPTCIGLTQNPVGV
jgi:hypothetical protein